MRKKITSGQFKCTSWQPSPNYGLVLIIKSDYTLDIQPRMVSLRLWLDSFFMLSHFYVELHVNVNFFARRPLSGYLYFISFSPSFEFMPTLFARGEFDNRKKFHRLKENANVSFDCSLSHAANNTIETKLHFSQTFSEHPKMFPQFGLIVPNKHL